MYEIKSFLKVKSKLFGTLQIPLVGRYEVGILLKHHIVTATTPTGITSSSSKGPTAAKSTAKGHTAANSRTTTLRAKKPHRGPLRRREQHVQHRLHRKYLAASTATKISIAAKSPTTEGPTVKGRMNHQLECLPRVEPPPRATPSPGLHRLHCISAASS